MTELQGVEESGKTTADVTAVVVDVAVAVEMFF